MTQHERDASDVSDVSSLHDNFEDLRQTTLPFRDHLKPQLSPSATRQYEAPNAEHPTQIVSEPEKPGSSGNLAKALEGHASGVWLMLLYVFAAIFSWTVTCILSHKPIGSPTYYDQSGDVFREDYVNSDRWRQAARIGQAVIAAVGIPVTSAVCTKATAVYCQRRSDARQPSLTLRQTLALADKGWSDLAIIRNLVRPSTSRRTRSGLLILSAGLVGLALIIPVLQSAFVNTVHIKVSSFQDQHQLLGFSTTPAEIMHMDQLPVVSSVTAATLTNKLSDKQPYLWVNGGGNLNLTSPADHLKGLSSFGNLASQLFTAGFPVGTDTGLYREIILRMNSSVSCELISQSDFPSSCEGNNPFIKSSTNINSLGPDTFDNPDDPKFKARLCAPGDTTASPWSATGNRQDITEDIYLDFQSTHLTNQITNFTQHCTAQTTMGYFELPNYWNGHLAGPLFDQAPNDAKNLTYFDMAYPNPTEFHFDTLLPVTGPLLTSIIAIFGNNTFFDAVASNTNYTDTNGLLCRQLRQPFTTLSVPDQLPDPALWHSTLFSAPASTTPQCHERANSTSNTILLNALLDWFPNFGDVETATAAFTLAIYQTNAAVLANNGATGFIFASTGYDMQKPSIALPAIIVITVLLFLQVTGLFLLAVFGARVPVWTGSLDAFALLRMGAAMHSELPLMSAMKAKELDVLDEKKGWVGDSGARQKGRQLVLGGPEGVKPNKKYQMVENEQEWLDQYSEMSGFKKIFLHHVLGRRLGLVKSYRKLGDAG